MFNGQKEAAEDEEEDLNALQQEIFLKLLVLGDLGVGKSSLIRCYTGEEQQETRGDYRVSVEPGFSTKRLDIGDGRKVHLQLWDIPGHERFGGMTKVYYKYAHGAIIVFDLSRPETFDSALGWLSDVTEKLFDDKEKTSSGLPQIEEANNAMPVILLANKCDLPDLKVSRHKYSSYVSENGLLSWFETSSRDRSNVSLAVKRLVEYILESDSQVKVASANARLWYDHHDGQL